MRRAMQYEKWMEKITANDMPNEDLKYIAQNAGLKMALMLIFLLPGLSIYIPKLALKKLKEHYIMTEYDGTRTTLNRLANGNYLRVMDCNEKIYIIKQDFLSPTE